MKKILCILLVICCFILPSCSEEKETLSDSDYIAWGASYIMALKVGDWPRYCSPGAYGRFFEEGENVFIATDMTERLVNLINYYLYDYPYSNKEQDKYVFSSIDTIFSDKLKNIKSIYEKHGITENNRLSVDWIMNNHVDSYDLLKDDAGYLIIYLGKFVKDNTDFEIFGTIYGLNIDEYKEYLECYDVALKDYLDSIVPWEKRLQIVKNYNNYFLGNNHISKNEDYVTTLSVAESYGLSKDNLMSVNWVMDNPYKAYHLMNDLPDNVREKIFTIADEDEDE